jgi:hypothetical protein
MIAHEFGEHVDGQTITPLQGRLRLSWLSSRNAITLTYSWDVSCYYMYIVKSID